MSGEAALAARELIVLRHGESEGNVAGLAQGDAPSPLTEAGRAHARTAARLVEEHGWTPERVVTSPVRRCVETAAIVTRALGLPDAAVEPAFTEVDHGTLTGRTYEEICDEDPDYFARDGWWWEGFRRWGGESTEDLVRRIAVPLGALAEDERVLVVTHGAVVKAVLSLVMGWDRPFLLGLRYGTLARLARKRVGFAESPALTHLLHADEFPAGHPPAADA